MSVVVTPFNASQPMNAYYYKVTNLIAGSNSISLPTPPALGSFPPLGDWTPSFIYCFSYNPGAVGAVVTPDLTTITNTNGLIAFTLWASGNTDCLIEVA